LRTAAKRNESQRKYCTTYKELLAVVTFVKQFRHYLWGQHLKVRTDHASLIWLKNLKNPEGMVARWIRVLDTHDMTLEHRRGSLHSNADGLSRRPHRKCIRDDCPDCTNSNLVSARKNESCGCETVSEILAPVRVIQPDPGKTQSIVQDEVEDDVVPNWLSLWSDEQISEWQNRDPDIKQILELKSLFLVKPPKECIQGCSYPIRTLWNCWDQLIVQNSILYYLYEAGNSEMTMLLVAPFEVRSKILEHLHDSRIGGHLGRDKTLASVKRRFFWPGMTSDVSQ